ncbi:MAG: prenyltransferase [Elusimicrobiota bacterium]
MSTFKKWFIVLRAYSWPASIVPIIISGVYSYKNGWFNWFDFIFIFIAGLSIHLGANVLNTYYDYKNNIDDENSDDIGIVKKFISADTAFKLGYGLILIGVFIGMFLVFKYSLYSFLPIAIIGVLLAIFYTANPVSLKYRAFGELVIFLCFGPLIVSGSVMIMAKRFVLESVALSIPAALLIVDILLANNIRDDKSDSEKGIKTIVDILGINLSRYIYIFLLFLSYISALVFLNFSTSSLVLLLSILVVYEIFKLLKKQDYGSVVRKTAQLVLIFGILFSIAIIL